ncbi:hypothetical protein GYH30_042117 [Glycine max]|uniref:Uncharacterized protein n=1 Tax=Glycine max TaxID=3847 RepID=A0A0R0GAD5_SOYBN|nr:hypothetical protein GYH30_042117 [Glycine max]
MQSSKTPPQITKVLKNPNSFNFPLVMGFGYMLMLFFCIELFLRFSFFLFFHEYIQLAMNRLLIIRTGNSMLQIYRPNKTLCLCLGNVLFLILRQAIMYFYNVLDLCCVDHKVFQVNV